jgi:ADP-heptose:LPS heptosyltransferase
VTIAPAALYPWKAWSPERYAELIMQLDKEIPCLVFLVGGQGDKEVLGRIANQSGVRTINCSGSLNLCQTAALLRRSALFIGNDSGLSHIAAAIKTPLIQLFGPGEPEKFGYTGPDRIVIQRTDCPHHPCQQRECITPGDWCMNRIAVADVLAAARHLLGESGANMRR